MARFNFFAEAYLAKSGTKKEPYRVGGIITTEDRDTDGEIVKSIDWSYFTGGFGKIKYEHTDLKEPDCFVGFPTKLFKSGKAWHFEGELVPFDPDLPEEKLTPQQKLAKSLVSLLQHIDEFNARHTDRKQRAGWSIEGEYLSKGANGLVKARAVNVVFTTKPRNTNTLATLIKSLDVGYGMSPDTQTGFAAFRKESLEGNSKNNDFNINKGDNKMFKTFESIYKSCRDNGMNHNDAIAEAKKQVTAKNKAVEDEFEKAQKSLGTSKEKLEKSVAELADISKLTLDFDVEEHQTKLQKSIKILQNEDEKEQDAVPFFKNIGEAVTSIAKSQAVLHKMVSGLAKSVATIIEDTKDKTETELFLQNVIADTRGEVQQLEKSIGMLVKSLSDKGGNLSTDNLDNHKIADNNKDDGTKKLNKSLTKEALYDLAKSGDIDANEAIKYETTGIMAETTMNILKSKKPDLFK